MNYLIIDDNDFAKVLCNEMNGNQDCPESNFIIAKEQTTSELAETIKAKINDNNDTVIFLNVNLKTKDGHRQAQKGIELLIWLRVKGILNHVVLYSFETLHALLNRNSKHLIATSKGTSFVQLPSNFEKIKNAIDENRLKQLKKEDIKDVKQTLKAYFSIDKFRHQEANWWGVKALWDVHRIVVGQSITQFPYPKKISEKNNTLNNQVGIFIYSNDDISIGSALNKNVDLKTGDRTYKIEGGHCLSITITNNQQEKYQNILKGIKYAVEARKPNILYIDDNANNGWKDILEKMTGVSITTIAPNKNNKKSTECLYNEDIKNMVINQNISLVLLDLRLYDETERSADIDTFSGKLLLDEIRKYHKGIPIMIVTASNKVWSYEELMKSGADAYWIKEGIDNNFTAEESVRNYYKLLWMIEKLTSEDYILIKTLTDLVEEINMSENSFWWENKDWARGATWSSQFISQNTQCSKETITSILNDGVGSLKEYLQTDSLCLRPKTVENDWYLPSLVIQHLGKIVEAVHNLNDEDYNIEGNYSKIINGKWNGQQFDLCRGDFRGKRIYSFRNQASHFSNAKAIEFESVKAFINIIKEYLLNDDTAYFGEKKINRIHKRNEGKSLDKVVFYDIKEGVKMKESRIKNCFENGESNEKNVNIRAYDYIKSGNSEFLNIETSLS